ncbi:MAG: hypothetical protein K2X99_07080 [Gemmatimonadaceae bacterium]|nr:hypothetical protein [Gemmatimonadaceae bacterium]
MTARATGLGAALLLAAATVDAQGIAARVRAAGTGTVRLEYAARAGVCGNGRGFISAGGRRVVHGAGRDEWEDDCEPGPVRLAIDVSGGEVTAIRAYVGGRWRGSAATELGRVGAREAAAFLLDLAAHGSGRAARDAIFPSGLADSTENWTQLLRIARDESRPREVRRDAVFWVAQAAADEATRGLRAVVGDDALDRDVREQAVFALSQRPKAEAIPALLQIAQTHRDKEIRRKAIFWLGQSNDPRAVDYFARVLERDD